MWVEMIVGGKLVTFSNAGTYLDEMGRDTRAEWAPKIEAEARKVCRRTEEVRFRMREGDLSIVLHDDAVNTVVRVISESIPRMPEAIQKFYENVAWYIANGERYTLEDLALLNQKQGPSLED